jgi:hypothetical protein
MPWFRLTLHSAKVSPSAHPELVDGRILSCTAFFVNWSGWDKIVCENRSNQPFDKLRVSGGGVFVQGDSELTRVSLDRFFALQKTLGIDGGLCSEWRTLKWDVCKIEKSILRTSFINTKNIKIFLCSQILRQKVWPVISVSKLSFRIRVVHSAFWEVNRNSLS